MDYFSKDWERIFEKLQSSLPFMELWKKEKAIQNSKINTDYLYWNKAKHYAKEIGLTEDELWALTKSLRTKGEKIFLPILIDFEKWFLFYPTTLIYQKLYNIDTLIIQIEQEKEKNIEDHLEYYYINGLIEEAFETSRIEGAQSKRKEAFTLILSGRPPENDHEKMILNAYNTSKKWIQNSSTLSKEVILEIHNDLIQNTKINPDEYTYRQGPVDIINNQQKILFSPTSEPKEILGSIESLVKWIQTPHQNNEFIHPLIQSILIHFWIAYIHPFYDGNGRTARLMFHKTILKYDRYKLLAHVPISAAIRKTRKDYENAFLFVEHDDLINQEFDLNYFIIYHLNVIQKSLEDFQNHIKTTQKNLQKLAKKLEWHNLNLRQLILCHDALKHPDTIYTINYHCTAFKVTRISAKKDLESLVKKELFTKSKRGKTLYFSLAPNTKLSTN